MIIGYARCSSISQNLDSQIDALQKFGCEKIVEEKASAVSGKRPKLEELLEFLREDDCLVVVRLDRLARNLAELMKIVEVCEKKKVRMVFITENIDTSSSVGKLMLGVLGSAAQFEANLRKERQLAGIAAAKSRNVKFGRRKVLSDAQVLEMKQKRRDGSSVKDLADDFGVSAPSVYRILNS